MARDETAQACVGDRPVDILARVVVEKCASSGVQREAGWGSSRVQRRSSRYLNDQRS